MSSNSMRSACLVFCFILFLAACQNPSGSSSSSGTSLYLSGTHDITVEVTSPDGLTTCDIKFWDSMAGGPWMTLGGATLPYTDTTTYVGMSGGGEYIKCQAIATVSGSHTLNMVIKVDGIVVSTATNTSSSLVDVSITGTY